MSYSKGINEKENKQRESYKKQLHLLERARRKEETKKKRGQDAGKVRKPGRTDRNKKR